MKSYIRISLGTLVCLLTFATLPAIAQEQDVLLKAMNDELQRNVSRLSLEGVSTPFFISYQVKDNRSVHIQATTGAITRFDTSHTRSMDVRVLVGDYKQTQEHYLASDLSFSYFNFNSSLPVENDYAAIRRALWLSTDRAYKSATEQLEKKRAAIKQQNLSEELKDLEDFSRAEPETHISPLHEAQMEISSLQERVQKLSGILKEYPEIYLSNVTLSVDQVTLYFVNSEGTVLRQPRTLVSFLASAATQAEDGEVLDDVIVHHALALDALPDDEKLASEIRMMAKDLVALRSAPLVEDSYSGPVLFEDQAAAELFVRLYLGSEGLVASRTPIIEGPMAMMSGQMQKRNLGEKINKRVLPKDVSISCVPGMTRYEETDLIGHFTVDAEGITPEERFDLVKNGKVLALMSDRVPTQFTKASTGHRTASLGMGLDDGVAPGVMEITVQEGESFKAMKGLLLERADDEGLEYAYIVRRIRPETVAPPALDDAFSMSFSMMQFGGGGQTPLGDGLQLLRVRVSDGTETVVRSAEVMRPGASAMRRIVVSKESKPWNTTLEGQSSIPGLGSFISIGRSIAGLSGGIPTSLITPRGVLIEELEVRKEKRPYTPKPPLVQSPLVK